MALTSGTTLGVYRVSGLLGKGGMGEVYRARDEKLGREVALKVLPSEFASNPDRLARFGREARLLASLSHPNIAGIHGLEESGETTFLVLELVEGETLAERLGRPLSTEQSLRLALQIAAALEAAHARGVIHRDLKPGNIKVAPDGTVKVLDFGLAKAFGPDGIETDVANSPTLSVAATAQGMILGTAGYMSPEQARGEEVTKQADIWAFGCILFEMLSGRQTWPGRSVTDVIASLVAREPEWSRLPAGLHPRVRFALERCLEKEPADRYHDITDVRLEIAKALADPGAAAVVTARETRRPGRTWVLAASAALAIIAAGLAGWFLKPEPARPIVRFMASLPAPFQQASIPPFSVLAISKDGKRWAISTINRLYVREAADAEARLVQGITAQAAISPTFSPDGEWLAYVDAPSTTSTTGLAIRKLPVTGGTPQTVAPLANLASTAEILGVDVSWDDRNMLTWVQHEGIMQVSASGGKPELVVRAQEGESLGSPQVLPGGDAILFTATTATGLNRWETAEIVVQAFGSEERTVVWRGGRNGRYVPTGHLVFAQGSTLFAVPFDLRRHAVTGGQTPLVEGLPSFGVPIASDTAQFAVSDAGSLLYLTGGAPQTIGIGNRPPPRGLAWVDRKGNQTPIRIRPDDYTTARISPDGSKVALVIGNPVGNDSATDIWVYDLATENSRQLTFDKADDDGPVWTSDSKRLYYRSFQDGDEMHSGVYWVPADGGAPTRVAMSKDFPYALPWSLSADGQTMALVSARTLQDVDLATLDIRSPSPEASAPKPPSPEASASKGESAFRVLLKGPPRILSEPTIAPNGQWVAYLQAEPNGMSEIDIRPFPDVARQRYPVGNGGNPVFSRDGSELFFFDGQGLSTAPIAYNPSLRIGAVQSLFRAQFWYGVGGPNGNLGRAWDVDRKGERFLMIQMPGAATPAKDAPPAPPIQISVVLNWLDELKARTSAR